MKWETGVPHTPGSVQGTVVTVGPAELSDPHSTSINEKALLLSNTSASSRNSLIVNYK
ncbi:hypothetical protein HO173_007622 [Letharia columbiana]|uniref:Uncharacterized protein n=1 Tax=Letharia columbiana TaxID=112416 RepID=A0A8H6FT13_9LECA|nr:uncharacterized protein HO173_007622 [Letharia columbiana]KAF6234202.1 hypothetical protein HO173_007622 [Letharia columbiana]